MIVCSYTRAAALRIREQVAADGVDIDPRNIGTIHAFCRKMIGADKPAENLIAEFSEENQHYAFRCEKKNADDPYATEDRQAANANDATWQEINILRARMVPIDKWGRRCQDMYRVWCDWKTRNGLTDFTDWLEISLREFDSPPNNAAAVFCDEVQDCSLLQLRLLEAWATKTLRTILAGDCDQTLYEFAGSSAIDFLAVVSQLPDANRLVLKQSYRVPKVVHAVAMKYVEKITQREKVVYLPRDFTGSATTCNGSSKCPELIVKEVERIVDSGKTAMVLASCSYMLSSVIKMLRERLVPFCNQYRPTDGVWNPLRRGVKQVTATDSVLAFLAPDKETWGASASGWSKRDAWAWLRNVKVKGILVAGAKQWIKTLKNDTEPLAVSELLEHVDSQAMKQLERVAFYSPEAVRESLAWLGSVLLPKAARTMDYPLRVAAKRGGAVLKVQPKVTVGTIHSVKGGEADVVFLMPDLSRAAIKQWHEGEEQRNSVRRMVYVGLTRAREDLVLCSAGSRDSFVVRI